ncbi:MAG: CPBP family intramembrane metalloprotease [Candidatus Omnitrophota bacterium]|nr:CPBP family intramembrane metalloprotease [Candidatus Omnitrophota bacterium]
MKKILKFIQKERLYILLFIFILTFNLIVLFCDRPKKIESASKPAVSAGAERENVRVLEEALKKNSRLVVIFSLASLLIFAIIILGIVIDLMLYPIILKKKLNIRTLSPPRAKWNMWDVCKVAILFIFFGQMIILTEAFWSRVIHLFKVDNFRMMINSSILDTLAVVFIIYFTVVQHREPLTALGISLKDYVKNIFYGVIGYVAIVPILILIVAVTAAILNVTKYVPQRQPVVELFLKENGVAFLTFSSLFAAIVGPIIEELFFRGFMYGALKKYIGITWAMVASACLFAALHAHVVGFFPIMALGLLLAYLYEKTGTLVSSITVHMIHNLSMVLLVFLLKQSGIV